jgi:SNF2 family DNA or RNA helicase
MLKRENLHDYQNKAVDFIWRKKKVGLLLDMGLGKTVSSLTAIVDLIDSLSAVKVLIIAPLRVANTVWHVEAKQWEHTKHLKINICTGSEKNRRAQLLKDADVYVINRENVEWLVNLYGKKWPFDTVVIDESSSFKSPSSRRFKALKKVAPMMDYCWLLTGTPTPNGLLDLWSQIFLLDQGERLGRNMTAYKQRFFESDFMGYKYTPRKGSDEKIHELLSDITLSMEAKDYLELPDRLDSTVKVQLTPKLMKQYKELEKEFLLELNDDVLIETPSAATLANKLVQFCNGAIYTDDLGNYEQLHKSKIEALNDLIEDNPNENILVAYNYKTDLERLIKKFPDAVVMDKEGEAVTKWNNGEIKLLLAHPASAGHGLNLQKGGSVVVWFGLNWSLELYQQFNARLHRQGQQKPVRIIHLVVDSCIDERIMIALTGKAKTQQELIDALKN